jgi:hypothetical protein
MKRLWPTGGCRAKNKPKTKKKKLMQIRPVETELSYVDGRTDGQTWQS